MISEALTSVRAQTRVPLETIVVDNASTNGTPEVAEREGARVIRLRTNRGAAAARNEGVRAAAGDAIALLDSDDYWDPHHLATVTPLLEQNPNAAAAAASVRLMGKKTGVWKGRIPEGAPAIVIREAFKDWLTPTTTTIVRRDAMLAVGGYDETARFSEDFDLWLRLARRFRFVAVREITATCRWHDTQVSANQDRQLIALYNFRNRAIVEIQREGDHALADELSQIFRILWANDVQRAWDQGRTEWLRKLVEHAPLVPGLPTSERLRWRLRSSIPDGARPVVRAVIRTARATLRS